MEVVRAVRAAVGPNLPVILRLSQWKQQDYAARLAGTSDEMAAWLLSLAEAGVDAFHCSQRRFWEPEFPEVDGEAGLNFAGWAKKLTGAAAITVGSAGLSGEFMAAFGGESSQPASLDNLVRRLEREEFDLVAVGRAILADPAWPPPRSARAPLVSWAASAPPTCRARLSRRAPALLQRQVARGRGDERFTQRVQHGARLHKGRDLVEVPRVRVAFDHLAGEFGRYAKR